MHIYISDSSGILTGPVELPVTPGIGAQMPSNAIQLNDALTNPALGNVWTLVSGQPKEIADQRGVIYRTDTGAEQQHTELGELPDGFTVESRPSSAHAWIDGKWQLSLELQSAHDAEKRKELQVLIDAERDRRIDAGVLFNSVLFQSRSTDRENIAGSAQLGFMAIVAGAQPDNLRWSNPNQDFVWIASDNSLVPMDAQTVVSFGKAAAERKQQLIFAARQIKDMQLIPTDYTDDKWWS